MTKQTSIKKAFTLVEILITIIIIGVLAGSLVLTVTNMRDKAKATQIVSNLRNLKAATISYYMGRGGMPAIVRAANDYSLLSVTVLQPYIDMDLSKYKLDSINADGVTGDFNANYKKGYFVYLMGTGTNIDSSKIGNLAFVAVWVGDESTGIKKALESMALSTPLFNGNYTQYIGQQETGAIPYYKAAAATANFNQNIIVMRVY